MESLYYRRISQKLKGHPEFEELVRLSIERKSQGSGSALLDLSVRGPQGSSLALILARLQARGLSSGLVVLPSEKEAEHLVQDLKALNAPVELWPGSGTTAYSPLPSNSQVFGRRTGILSRLAQGEAMLLVGSLRSVSTYLPPKHYIKQNTIRLQRSRDIEPQSLAARLVGLGYLRVSKVSVQGEFALRGEVLDISMPGANEAVRIVFSYDKIEDIRLFDMGTQASVERRQEILIHPFREVSWTQERREKLESRLMTLPELAHRREGIEAIIGQETGTFDGEELWYAFAFDDPVLLPAYMEDALVVFAEYERLKSAEDGMFREYDSLYRKLRHESLLPRPQSILCGLDELTELCQRKIRIPALPETLKELKEIRFKLDAPRSFFGNINFMKEELESLQKAGYEVFVLAESEVQKQRLETLLEGQKLQVDLQGLRSGFAFPDLKIQIIHEHEIFGRRRRIPKSVHKVKSEAIESFIDLEVLDYVVHINHGIGRFLGIQRVEAAGSERDYIKLQYADEESVFVPIEQVNLIQKYIGGQGSDPRLDKLGGRSWESRKERVRRRVEEIAQELIELYSRRRLAQGFVFPPDTEWQVQFESRFPFEETEDQLRCIEEVKADMEKLQPMDRLVCGDVGFGKTEVAMRAAFKAVNAGKQVAFLAPTTILAEQHQESLRERFQGFPVNISMLSRFVPKSEQKAILEKLGKGEVDILVGTHRILQKDVRFKDLGLLIVDEEQRFGVKDKERLKALRASVDCLTLSATPIPRTLHMSLLKIRDMSLIKTAPHNRRPIETHVEAFDENLVASAIRRELSRGGQVFYLHNRIESLEFIQRFLQRVVPEVLVETAHGQMAAKELEDVMHRFVHGGFQVLLSTTIIENGINIPNVNTIIIDRADMYGVSQLYQLRGRVGRSDKLAYAFLFYPGERVLSEIAMKRLRIISDHTDLGSGFKIALKDLEVRGAGNLLGAEQSGEIYSVGFDLYLKLLDEAVNKLARQSDDPDLASSVSVDDIPETYLELEYSGFIPESYISDPMEKMEIYKKISSVASDPELEAVYAEIEDRFGPPPEEVLSLLSLAELRIISAKLRILSMRERRGWVEIEFGKLALINIDRLLSMVRNSGGAVTPVPKQPNRIRMRSDGIGLKAKSEFIRGRLSQLIK